MPSKNAFKKKSRGSRDHRKHIRKPHLNQGQVLELLQAGRELDVVVLPWDDRQSLVFWKAGSLLNS